MRGYLRTLALLALVTIGGAAGCGKDSTAPRPSMSGTWRGTLEGAAVSLTLAEASGGAVTGSGTVGAVAESVTGAVAGSDVSLTLHANGFEDANVSGAFQGGGTVVGTVTGSGYVNSALTLTRQ